MLREQIEAYQPFNEQEAFDKKAILAFIDRNPDYLLRSNLMAHFTVSTIVVNPAMDKVLFAHHNIYKSWGWLGGHNDGDEDMLNVAMKETEEESGLTKIKPYSKEIFMLDTIYVPNHIKHGKHVSDHLHLNATFLVVADESEKPIVNVEENSGVKWFPIATVLKIVHEPRMIPIYQKAFQRIALLKNLKVKTIL
jgi:8-oxo-dGTP pyrophosphatase MutT (NUDIX family)